MPSTQQATRKAHLDVVIQKEGIPGLLQSCTCTYFDPGLHILEYFPQHVLQLGWILVCRVQVMSSLETNSNVLVDDKAKPVALRQPKAMIYDAVQSSVVGTRQCPVVYALCVVWVRLESASSL